VEGQPPANGDEPSPSTELRTFLIADVRGWTAYTREHGDEAAAELAAAFATSVRDVVGDHGGYLLELRGDEALVVFVSARQALRASVELQARFTDSGLARPVGIGLDAGEAVPVEGGYRGGALNLAARLCSRAEGGEILASETVIHLAARVEGLAYVEPRTLRLKGYEKPVRAVEVVSSDRAPRAKLAGRIRRVRRSLGAHRRAAIAAVVVVLVVALVAAILPGILGSEGSPHSSLRSGMALIDAETADVRGFVGNGSIDQPAEVIYADGSFWVLNLNPISFVQLDPSGRILSQIASPFGDVGYFAVDGDTLWVTQFDGSGVSKIDIDLGREIDRFFVADDPDSQSTAGIAVGAGSLWIARPDDDDGSGRIGVLLRVDPESGEVEHRFPGLFGVISVAFADGQVWTNGNGITRIDPATNTVAATASVSGAFVSAGGGFGWTADESKGVLYKIDTNGNVADSYPTGAGARNVWYSDGVIWVSNQDVGTVTGIDAVTGDRRTFRFEHPLQAVAAGSGVVLVQLNRGKTYEDRIDALTGDVARLLIEGYQLEGVDPATLSSFVGFQVEYATCAKLLNYPDEQGPGGAILQPEVAASMPELSADGRTYTFRIREGFAFSPPSNEPLTAETFRFSIERALSPRIDGPGASFVSDIEGQESFASGEADHISGLRARDDTLTVTLVRPSGDFLQRLALPFFCPVPTDTPSVRDGAVYYAADDNPGAVQYVPSAGPYYIADFFNGEYAILRRNPNYGGSRPQHLDAIALREGIDAGQAIARVNDGGWDGITNLYNLLLDNGGQLADRWGPASEAAADGDQRYFPTPWPHTGFIAFNAGRPTFADARSRKAASLALDRAALAAVWGQIPTDQLLPPTMPGWKDRDLYAMESDEAAADPLVDGRKRSAVMGIFTECAPCEQEAQIVRANLATIGIDVRIREFDNPWDAANRGVAIDLIDSGAQLDYADPARFLESMLNEAMPPAWLPAEVQRQIDELVGLTGSQRVAEATALADRLAADQVPLAAVGNGVIGEYFSPRLGCRVFPPMGFGVDLAALCLESGG
jgi:ABC-type oligopeptide transport system substrate-binding subunit/class 3 adenylate cyclase